MLQRRVAQLQDPWKDERDPLPSGIDPMVLPRDMDSVMPSRSYEERVAWNFRNGYVTSPSACLQPFSHTSSPAESLGPRT